MSMRPEGSGRESGRRVPPQDQAPDRAPGRSPGPFGGGARPPAFQVPRVILALLGAMLVIHLLRLGLGQPEASELTYALALVIFDGTAGPLEPGRFYTLVSHALVHGSWMHLFFNGLWLLLLGTRVHQGLGTLRFLIFFVLTAIGGAAAQILLDYGQPAILIGASGVVFGLLGAGAYLWVLRPHDRGRERLKKLAWYCVIMMLLNLGYASVGGMGGMDNIAWQAHLGGFFAGLAVFPLLYRRRRVRLAEFEDDS